MEINPIIIIFKNGKYQIVNGGPDNTTIPLQQGFMINSKHRGFIIAGSIVSSMVTKPYITDNFIAAIGIDDGYLKIFEYGKRNPWVFRNGILIKEASIDKSLSESMVDEVFIATDNYNMFGEEAKLDSPIHIVLNKDLKSCHMILDRGTKAERSYNINPAGFLGGTESHYGFKIIRESGGVEQAFPTQKRIDALGIEGDDTLIKVYEDTKWSPWKFTAKGELLEEAKYLPFSRKDLEAVRKYLEENKDRSLHIKSL